MSGERQATEALPIEPSCCQPGDPLHDWFALPASDAVAGYLEATHWGGPKAPTGWQVARLSSAAYIYREDSTGWAVVAKFHAAKTGADAGRHAEREYDYTGQARAIDFREEGMRVICPLSLWRGVLFLEHVDGLTLEDMIAVRRSRPGTFIPAMERAVKLLARLHTSEAHSGIPADAGNPAAYTRKVIDNLARHGVLQHDPVVCDALNRLVDRWAEKPVMVDYEPVFNHGDATTTNFVFPWESGSVVGIDWERSKVTDPASDVGRLTAEVGHSITRHGGTTAEAVAVLDHLWQVYCRECPDRWDTSAMGERVRFHQASSTLRIARNGWLSRLERTALVAQALALLS